MLPDSHPPHWYNSLRQKRMKEKLEIIRLVDSTMRTPLMQTLNLRLKIIIRWNSRTS